MAGSRKISSGDEHKFSTKLKTVHACNLMITVHYVSSERRWKE